MAPAVSAAPCDPDRHPATQHTIHRFQRRCPQHLSCAAMNAFLPPAAANRGCRKVSISRLDVCTCHCLHKHCLISSGPCPAMLSMMSTTLLSILLRFNGFPARPGPPVRSVQQTAACSSRAF
eukprot:7387315-Prymnesium_polylepis.1